MGLWNSKVIDLEVALASALEKVTASDLQAMIESEEWAELQVELEKRVKPFQTKVTRKTMQREFG